MSATTSDRAPGFLGRIRRFRPLAVPWHEVFSPLSAEECTERLWQTAQTEGAIPWQFRDSRATRREQETRRPEVVGTVTGAALSCSVTGRQPPPSILASGQFRPTPDGTLVAVAFGPSRAHVLAADRGHGPLRCFPRRTRGPLSRRPVRRRLRCHEGATDLQRGPAAPDPDPRMAHGERQGAGAVRRRGAARLLVRFAPGFDSGSAATSSSLLRACRCTEYRNQVDDDDEQHRAAVKGANRSKAMASRRPSSEGRG